MGQSAAVNGLPPLPPGATLMSGGGGGLPPLPPGATMTTPAAPPQPALDPKWAVYTTPVNPSAQEGSYNMHAPDGTVVTTRYSRISKALDDGLLFTDKPTLQQYARDHAADPLSESRVDKYIDKHPYLTTPLQTWKGMGHALVASATGLDPTPTNRFSTDLQLHAATPPHTAKEAMGGWGEAAGEFMTGNELMEMLGGSKLAMTGLEQLKNATGLKTLIEKAPIIGKLIKIGASSVKQGTLAAGQTYMKTGDPRAALQAGGAAALAGPVAEAIGAGGTAINTAFSAPAEAAAEAETAAAATRGQATTNAATTNAAAQAERDAATAAAAARQQHAATSAAAINQAAQAERDAATATTEAARKEAATRSADAINQAAQAERDAAAAREQTATKSAATINAAAQAERDAAAARAAGRPGTAQYAQEARAAAKPVLEQVNASRDVPTAEVKVAQPGGQSVGTGQRLAIATGRPVQPPIDIEGTLAQKQDFTGAADTLEEHAQPIYDQFDQVTNGQFRKLNGQVQAAKQAMYDGEKGAAEAYQKKLEQMHTLMDSTSGDMTPEQLAAGKALWTKQYVMRDVGNLLDKHINRVPGGTDPEGEIDGKAMLKGLQRVVARYKGRARVDEALGPGRLDTLEGIAQANTTDAKREEFQTAFTTVKDELDKLVKADSAAAKGGFKHEFTTPEAELEKLKTSAAAAKPNFQHEFTTPEAELARLEKADRAAAKAGKQNFQYQFTTPEAELAKLTKKAPAPKEDQGGMSPFGKRMVAASIGGGVAHAAGVSPYWGMAVGEATYESGRVVMNALQTNPKIAKNFLFALQSGARQEKYGPLIAGMIAKWQTDASNKKQQQQQQQQKETQ